MYDELRITLILITTLYLSDLGIKRMILWATSKGILDVPGERSSHSIATPTGGGIVIALVTIIVYLISSTILPSWFKFDIASFLIASIVIALIGWMDDLYSVSALWRFSIQSVVAVFMIVTVGLYDEIGIYDYSISLSWLGFPITFLWIVGLINAFNFMDGIDGNAGGISVVAGIFWCLISIYQGELSLFVLSILVIMSCFGFLMHNWHPAKIFMGDSGSTFLGFTFAVIPLFMYQSTGNIKIPIVGVLIVSPWIWDAIYTFLRRLFRKESVFTAHRTYMYQRLTTAGYSHSLGSAIYIALCMLTGMLGYIYITSTASRHLLIVLCCSIVLIGQLVLVLIAEGRQHS